MMLGGVGQRVSAGHVQRVWREHERPGDVTRIRLDNGSESMARPPTLDAERKSNSIGPTAWGNPPNPGKGHVRMSGGRSDAGKTRVLANAATADFLFGRLRRTRLPKITAVC